MAEPLVALFPLAPEHAARVLARALANVRGLGGPNSGRYPKGSGKKNNVASLTNHGDRAIIDHILEGHDVGVVIRHVGEHVGALDEWIKQKPDDVIVIVPRKPRDLDGSNSGRYPKGSSNKSKSTTQILLAHLPKAVHIRDTKFILPDGMRLAHNYDTHGEAIRGAFEASGDKKMAESLYGGYKSAYELMFKEGIVRYSGDYGGVQIGRPLTEKQAQIIADDWNHVYKKALPIDAYESKIFQPPFNADTIRNWSRSQFRTPLNRAAGGPNSGRYPRGSGKDPQSGIKLQRTGKQDVKIVTKDGIINASGLDIKDGDIFETLRKLAPGEYQLRFLYEPHTNRFIIGTSSIDRSHAEDLVDSGAGGFYDKYVKGWIGNAPVGFSGKTEPYIQFAHGLARHSMLELGFQGADRGEIFEAYSKALQFFVEHGASENTQLKGVGHFLRDSNGPLGELVPAYLAKRRAAGGPNSGRYPKGSTNNTGSALAGDLNEVLPRATVVKQWIADAGLYHGTSDDALASIKANGLIPGGSKGSDAWFITQTGRPIGAPRPVSVFMAPNLNRAINYAELAQKMRGGKPVLLKIRIPEDAANIIETDEYDEEAVRVARAIPPEWIESVGEITIDESSISRVKGTTVKWRQLEIGDRIIYAMFICDELKTLGGPNSGRYPRGSGKDPQSRERMDGYMRDQPLVYKTTSPHQTRFILSDGERLGSSHAHERAAGQLGKVLAGGVVRYTPGQGVHVSTVPTEAQARVIVDDFNEVFRGSLLVDVSDPGESLITFASEELERPTVDGLRNTVRRLLKDESNWRQRMKARKDRRLGGPDSGRYPRGSGKKNLYKSLAARGLRTYNISQLHPEVVRIMNATESDASISKEMIDGINKGLDDIERDAPLIYKTLKKSVPIVFADYDPESATATFGLHRDLHPDIDGSRARALERVIERIETDAPIPPSWEPRTLGGPNSGRYPRGSGKDPQASGSTTREDKLHSDVSNKIFSAVRDHLPVAKTPYETGFLLPDGSRRTIPARIHERAILNALKKTGASQDELDYAEGIAIDLALKQGIVRYRQDGGVQVGRALTEIQAQVVADDWNYYYKDTLFIDGLESNTASFEIPVTADALRNWSRREGRVAGGPGSGRYPKGSGKDRIQVGITSVRPGTTEKQTTEAMNEFASQLKSIPGVTDASITKGTGIFFGVAEPTWVVVYSGNGEARKLLARTAERYNQDSVLIMRAGDTNIGVDLTFDQKISGARIPHIQKMMKNLEIAGGTWFADANGRTVLRMASVKAWGVDKEAHRIATEKLAALLNKIGTRVKMLVQDIGTEVIENKDYAKVQRGLQDGTSRGRNSRSVLTIGRRRRIWKDAGRGYRVPATSRMAEQGRRRSSHVYTAFGDRRSRFAGGPGNGRYPKGSGGLAGVGGGRGAVPPPPASWPKPNEVAQEIARTYTRARGMADVDHSTYHTVNTAQARDIAAAYDALPVDDSQNPEVVEAYEALGREVNDQYAHAVKAGMQFIPWTKEGQPYANSDEMAKDVRENKRLYFFTGGEPNPFLSKVDTETGLTLNDKFRAIHNYFGHAAGGFGFGPHGEENAWAVHSQMFSPSARKAMTTETRGQNSWVNFGTQNYDAQGNYRNIPAVDRPFATQKVALLPERYTRLTKPRAAGGSNSGRYPRGSGKNPSKSTADVLRAFLPVAKTPDETRFILPDGTRLTHSYATHGQAIYAAFHQPGKVDMEDPYRRIFKEGIVRYSGKYGGFQFGRPLTEAQAEILADDWNLVYKNSLPADVYFGDSDSYNNRSYAEISRTFQPPFTADTLRNWSKSRFNPPQARAAGGPGSGRYPKGSGKANEPSGPAFDIWDDRIQNDPDYEKVWWAYSHAQIEHQQATAQLERSQAEGETRVVRRRAEEVAEQMGIDPSVINVVHEDPREFTVGDRSFKEAGHYSPATGMIQINAKNAYDARMEVTNGLVTHEISHLMLDRVRKEQEAEHKAILELPPAEYKRLFGNDGYLDTHKPGITEEARTRFPASMTMADTWSDGFISADDSIRQKMIDENGHSPYAKAYWEKTVATQSGGIDRAANETLAEVNRYLLHPASWNSPISVNPKSVWIAHANAVRKLYADLAKRDREQFKKDLRAGGGPNSGRYPSGSKNNVLNSIGSAGSSVDVTKTLLKTTTYPKATKFIGPDGTRYTSSSSGDQHSDMVKPYKLDEFVRAGFIRYASDTGGVEVRASITEAQAQLIADDWNYSYDMPLFVDVKLPGMSDLSYKMFPKPINADALRRFVNSGGKSLPRAAEFYGLGGPNSGRYPKGSGEKTGSGNFGHLGRYPKGSGEKTGSGNFGHLGRKGQVGGSGKGTGSAGTVEDDAKPRDTDFPLQGMDTNFEPIDLDPADFDAASKSLGVDARGLVNGMSRLAQQWSKDGTTFARWDKEKETLTVFVTSQIDGEETRMARIFKKSADGISVHHDVFELPDDAQAGGIGTRMLADSLQMYERYGVTGITTQANESIGGYAWVKLGYKARDTTRFIDMAMDRMEQPDNLFASGRRRLMSGLLTEPVGFDRRMELRALMQAAGPDAPRVLAEQPEGKAVLIGSLWQASIDLKSDDAKAIKARLAKKLGRG